LEKKALLEIVNNFRAIFTNAVEVEQNKSLNKLLAMPDVNHKNWQEPRRASDKKTNILKKGRISIRNTPDSKRGFECGYLDSDGTSQVAVSNSMCTKSGENWSLIQVPRYAEFAHIYTPIYFVRLKPTHSVGNVRGSADSSIENVIFQMKRNRRTKHSDQLKMIESGLGADQLWYKVEVDDGGMGYVHQSVVEVVEEVGEVQSECKTGQLYVRSEDLSAIPMTYSKGKEFVAEIIGAGRASVRERAQSSANAVDVLDAGDNIIVIGDNNQSGDSQWFKVQLPEDGSVGWIWAERVRIKHEVRD
jgi:hypothetical protein